MKVKEYLADKLKADGFGGLCLYDNYRDTVCSCFIDNEDFIPCSGILSGLLWCQPGYKFLGDDGDAYITPNKSGGKK